MSALERVRNGLIVSCQALEEEPLHGPMLMAAMARAAHLGGAAGIRANGVQDVEVCRAITGLPVIGIQKAADEQGRICVTPTFDDARRLAEAGADIVAVDCRRNRPLGEPLEELLPRVGAGLDVLIMADCETLADAEQAVSLGADIVSSTFGFQSDPYGICPDFALIAGMNALPCPMIAEGGFWTPEQVERAFAIGVWSVVIGSAITRPMDITKRFLKAVPKPSP